MKPFIFLFLTLGFFTNPINSLKAGDKWFIAPEDVKRAGTPNLQNMQVLGAIKGKGPAIHVQDPKALKKLNTPVKILISFVPGQSGEFPDMKSLLVTLFGFFEIDITDRVREYIDGYKLNVEDADIPEGRHLIRITIEDVSGNTNERDIVLNVAPN